MYATLRRSVREAGGWFELTLFQRNGGEPFQGQVRGINRQAGRFQHSHTQDGFTIFRPKKDPSRRDLAHDFNPGKSKRYRQIKKGTIRKAMTI